MRQIWKKKYFWMLPNQKVDIFWFRQYFYNSASQNCTNIVWAVRIPQNFGRLAFAFYFFSLLSVKKFLIQNVANAFNSSPCQLFNSSTFLFQKMNIHSVFICLFDKYSWMLNNLSLKLTCQSNHDTNIMMKHYSALKMNFCNSNNWPLGHCWLMKQYFNRNRTNLCAGLQEKSAYSMWKFIWLSMKKSWRL